MPIALALMFLRNAQAALGGAVPPALGDMVADFSTATDESQVIPTLFGDETA